MTARRARRSRGFTLLELIVYLALVTGSLTVIVGLELAASRASFLERALIELAMRGDDLGTRFRDDVRQATSIVVPPAPTGQRPHGPLLVLRLSSGQEIRYELEDCAKLDASTDEAHQRIARAATDARLVRLVSLKPGADVRERTVYPNLERLLFQRETRGTRALYTLDAMFAYARGGEITARRTFHFSASPVAEESP